MRRIWKASSWSAAGAERGSGRPRIQRSGASSATGSRRWKPRSQTLAADLLTFSTQTDLLTLAHTDVYYGHIFQQGGRVTVIDWGQTRYAPLILDLGDTFDTAEAAQLYRAALAARGIVLDDATYQAGHRLARRFAGIRYVWWWLESWQQHPQDWNRAGLERMLGMAAGQPG